jgi:hypothetical protein
LIVVVRDAAFLVEDEFQLKPTRLAGTEREGRISCIQIEPPLTLARNHHLVGGAF